MSASATPSSPSRPRQAVELDAPDRLVEAAPHDADAQARRRRGLLSSTIRVALSRRGPTGLSYPVTSRPKPDMLGHPRGAAMSRILPTPEVAQDLRADAVGGADPAARACGGAAAAMRASARGSVPRSREQFSSTTTPSPPARSPQRLVHRPRVARRVDVEQVEQRQRLVHAHQRLGAGLDLAAHQREVGLAARLVAVGEQPERGRTASRSRARRRARSALSLRLR